MDLESGLKTRIVPVGIGVASSVGIKPAVLASRESRTGSLEPAIWEIGPFGTLLLGNLLRPAPGSKAPLAFCLAGKSSAHRIATQRCHCL